MAAVYDTKNKDNRHFDTFAWWQWDFFPVVDVLLNEGVKKNIQSKVMKLHLCPYVTMLCIIYIFYITFLA